MSANPVDTLGTARDLEAAGFERTQAEAIALATAAPTSVPPPGPTSRHWRRRRSFLPSKRG